MPPVGFESTILAGERPLTYALDRTVAETGNDGYIVARNMYRKEINIFVPRKIVHQVGFIYKIIQKCIVNKT
jgi:hypothetical protein